METEEDYDVTVYFPQDDHGKTWQVVDEYLSAEERTGRDAIMAELARQAADVADSARREQDPKLWLQATTRLMVLVDKQPKQTKDTFQEELFSAIDGEPE